MKGLVETLTAGFSRLQTKSSDFSALTWERLTGEASSKAGVSVNLDTALRVSTVLACCRVIAEGVAQLPLLVGSHDQDGAFQVQRQDPLFRMLHRRPNDWMTSFELRETLTYNAVLTGYGFAVKNKLRGEVRELLPVATTYCNWRRTPNWGWVVDINDPFGAVGTFLAKDLLIVRGPSWDGVMPFNIMRLAREAIGLAIATEEAHARLHANGARPGGIISVDTGLGKEARDRIKEAANEFKRTGAFNTMVLDKGAKWEAMGMSGVDAQHLETRRFQIEEICRDFRVFPHMVGYQDKVATFASAESFFRGHVTHTLMPWLRRWTEALERDVTDSRDLVVRFDVSDLLQGDTAARAEFYAKGIVNGWLTRNDARRMEGKNPLPGLDEPLQPLNMTTVGALDAADPGAAKAVKAFAAEELRRFKVIAGGRDVTDAEVDALSDRLASGIHRLLRRAT